MNHYKIPAVIIDIDGTVSEKHGGRNYFEWDKVDKDVENVNICNIIRSLPEGWSQLFVSGRDSVCYDMTFKWLNDHGLFPNQLIMREKGDKRDDTIVKKEIYDKYIKDNYEVTAVFDDRAKVVKMWREELGLTVLQVAEGNY